ncbi:MAG: DUF4159 domain-containing protein [Acidobacteria bacterium]|nr:DUF4159 domain-containing protein [Acidobacteriota bacterium]
MPLRRLLVIPLLGMALVAQKPFRVYHSLEPYDNVELPADFNEKTEWVFARLMYPPHPNARFGRYRFGSGHVWTEGGTSWSQDYPRADRHFSQALRRLTRIHVRSVEQPVNPDDADDIFNWPWLCAGEMGDWKLTDAQAHKLRDYLLRGGFLMLDDFWGTEEWNRFEESMVRVFPDRPIVEIESPDPIFHTVYDLDDRYQIPGEWALRRGATYRSDGSVPHWMGIHDDQGRVMVAIAFNSDIGDSWEWADEPGYPEKYSALGIRIGVNYVVYALTH